MCVAGGLRLAASAAGGSALAFIGTNDDLIINSCIIYY